MEDNSLPTSTSADRQNKKSVEHTECVLKASSHQPYHDRISVDVYIAYMTATLPEPMFP